MDWIKKHADTAIIISSVCASLMWMNSNLNSLKDSMRDSIGNIEKRLIRIETILIMKGIAAPEMLASQEKE